MSRTGKLLAALLLAASSAPAQDRRPTVADIPPVERQTPDFYGAIAAGRSGVRVAWSVDRTEVSLDSEVSLTLTVRNAANPQELTRPNLSARDDFARDFQVFDGTTPPPPPDADEVRFVYRLRPRAVDTATVPALRYRYYRPDLPEGRRFPTTYADPLTITVTPPKPKEVPVAAPVPLDAPEEFFTLADDRPTLASGRSVWLVPAVLIPFRVGGWVAVWRRLFPNAARLARLRRSRAVRIALDRLRKARTSDDPTEVAAAAVRGYLVARFGVPPTAQTPAEVVAGLRLVERENLAADAEAFLRACDAARFADTRDDGLPLTDRAEAMVVRWEEHAA